MKAAVLFLMALGLAAGTEAVLMRILQAPGWAAAVAILATMVTFSWVWMRTGGPA